MLTVFLQRRFSLGVCGILVAAFFCLQLGDQQCQAHPISISDVYVEVLPEKLDVRIEVFAEDLYLFHELPLDEQNRLSLEAIEKGIQLHRKYLEENFLILDKDGDPLTPKFQEVDTDDLPGVAIPFQQLMFYRLVYHFEFPLEETPEYLTFLQKFTSEKSALPAEVQVKVKPPAGRRLQQLLLPNQPWTTPLPTTEEETAELTPQERLEQERQQNLGLKSYGETYSFLYAEPEQFRLEVLVPLATLAGSLELEADLSGKLTPEEQDALKDEIEQLFLKTMELKVDDRVREWSVERIEFFGVTIRDLSQQRKRKPVSIASARVGIILSTSHPSVADSVSLVWSLFNESLYQTELVFVQGNETSRKMIRQVEDQNQVQFPLQPLPANENQRTGPLVADSRLVELLRTHQQLNWKAFWMFVGTGSFLIVCLVGFGLTITGSAWLSRVCWFLICFSGVGASTLGTLGYMNYQEAEAIEEQIPAEISGADLLESLLNRVYQAVNQQSESATLESLENVVAGPLLRDLYLEIRKTMTMESQSGAVSRAGEVEIENTEPLAVEYTSGDLPTLTYECSWSVPGRVEHWGHIHQRTNRYSAHITLRLERNGRKYFWKITDVDLRNVEQAPIKTSVRTF